jgi:hypothetical protein
LDHGILQWNFGFNGIWRSMTAAYAVFAADMCNLSSPRASLEARRRGFRRA